MAAAFVIAPLAGILVARQWGWDNRWDNKYAKLANVGFLLCLTALVTSVLLGLTLLSIKINRAVWKDGGYSPTAWNALNKGAQYSAWVALAGFALFALTYCPCCRQAQQERVLVASDYEGSVGGGGAEDAYGRFYG